MSRCIMELETHGGFFQWCEGHIHHLQPQLSTLLPGADSPVVHWDSILEMVEHSSSKCPHSFIDLYIYTVDH